MRAALACLLGVCCFPVSADSQQDSALAAQISMSLLEVYQKAIVAPLILPSCEPRSASAQMILDDESYVGRWVMLNTQAMMRAWPLDHESGETLVRNLQSIMSDARSPAQVSLMRDELRALDVKQITQLCGETEVLADRMAHALANQRWAAAGGGRPEAHKE